MTSLLFVLAIAGISAGSAAWATGHDHPPVSPETDRYACRRDVEVPPHAHFGSIEPHRRGGPTEFDPLIEEMIGEMTSAHFAQNLGELCGAYVVQVGGQCVTFSTRYSLSAQGELAWQYALERLQHAGWDVALHEYSRNGHDLANVVATKLGSVTPDRIYVLGAHIDSISQTPSTLAPGAEDNASGSSGVLQAALAFADYEFESTIELVLFSGEEQGLWGSEAYVADALAAGRDIRSAVTFDMISYYDGRYGVLIEGETAWTPLMSVMSDAVAAYTDLGQELSFFSFGSDHVSFQDAGIPAILAIDLDWDVYPYYHRTTDTFEHVIPDFGIQIARAGAATVAHLAGVLGTTVEVPDAAPTTVLTLHPNPALRTLRIALDASLGAHVDVFALDGRHVRRLLVPGSGFSRLTWDLTDGSGRRVPAGVYFVRAGSQVERLIALR